MKKLVQIYLSLLPIILIGLIPSAYANVEVQGVNICGEITTVTFPFLIVCDSLQSEGIVTPGISSGSGSTSTQSAGFHEVDITLKQNPTIFSLGSTTTQSISISWDNGDPLQLNEVVPTESQMGNLKISFQDVPIIMTGDSDGSSQVDLLYSLSVPKDYCGDTISIGCIENKIYEIPLEFQFNQQNRIFRQSMILILDIMQKETPILGFIDLGTLREIDPLYLVLFGSTAGLFALIGIQAKKSSSGKKQKKHNTPKHSKKGEKGNVTGIKKSQMFKSIKRKPVKHTKFIERKPVKHTKRT